MGLWRCSDKDDWATPDPSVGLLLVGLVALVVLAHGSLSEDAASGVRACRPGHEVAVPGFHQPYRLLLRPGRSPDTQVSGTGGCSCCSCCRGFPCHGLHRQGALALYAAASDGASNALIGGCVVYVQWYRASRADALRVRVSAVCVLHVGKPRGHVIMCILPTMQQVVAHAQLRPPQASLHWVPHGSPKGAAPLNSSRPTYAAMLIQLTYRGYNERSVEPPTITMQDLSSCLRSMREAEACATAYITQPGWYSSCVALAWLLAFALVVG
jgi:hypothetical protein